MQWIDTHAHLDYTYEKPTAEVIQDAVDAGVQSMVTIGTTPESLPQVQELAENHKQIWFTLGIHPHEAKDYSAKVDEDIRKGSAHQKCLAVGEIGLDYYYDHSDRETQREVFRKQLRIAEEVELPIVIHTREAEEDTLALFDEIPPAESIQKDLGPRGIIHSFTGSAWFAKECIKRDFFIAFNGISTFKNAESIRDVIKETPLERILLETDCPYLAPVPFRGKKNQPAYLVYVAKQVAECKDVGLEELSEHTLNNTRKVFRKMS
jgi:TatD DNase family protein